MDIETSIKIIRSHGLEYVVLMNVTNSKENDPVQLISSSMKDHLSGKDLMEFIGAREKIGIIVNDRNRSTKTSMVLEWFMEQYPDVLQKAILIIATGTHVEPTDDDLHTIMGKTYSNLSKRCHIHRSRNEEQHSYRGTTSRGTEIYLDRVIEDLDYLIFINSIEPHYFAGFTGGRKSLLPGIASFKTIEKNHSMALDQGSGTTALEGNPVHEDMLEAAKIALQGKDHLSIQLIQPPGGHLGSVVIGDIFTSFEKGVKISKKYFCSIIDQTYDIVVTIAREPMDRTLYQAQKALEHGKLALSPGGTIILVASCREGIGQSTFWDLLSYNEEPDEVLSSIEKGYKLGYHKAARIAQLARSSNIFLVSDLDQRIVKKGFMMGFSSLDNAIEKAVKMYEKKPTVALIPDGCVTVPTFGPNGEG